MQDEQRVHMLWPDVLAALKRRSIVTWANVSTNARLVRADGDCVLVAFSKAAAMQNFTNGAKVPILASALTDVLGGTWQVAVCAA